MQRLAKKKMSKKNKKTLYGDTIVEAVVAIAIYSIVAVLALGSMSSGLSTAQRNLESTMSRSMIDSQSDTLRYFYESYLATKTGLSDDSYYGEIWKRIKPKNDDGDQWPASIDDPALSDNSCEALINEDRNRVEADNSEDSVTHTQLSIFALSGRGALSDAKTALDRTYIYGFGTPQNIDWYIKKQVLDGSALGGQIVAAPLYPRITYKNMNNVGTTIYDPEATGVSAMDFLGGSGGKDEDGNVLFQSRAAYRAEGVWIYPKKTDMGYDFYVRTCWNPVGSKSPSTFTSVVRLYNAE